MSESLADYLGQVPIFSNLTLPELQTIEKYMFFNKVEIGEMALIDKLMRSASVRACTTSGLIVLTRKGFEMILKLHPDIGIKILKGISSLLSINLRKTSDKLAEFMPPLA